MKRALFLTAVLAAALVACEKEKAVKEINEVPEGMKRIEITVSVEQPTDADSKASLSSTTVAFAENDQIAVVGTKNDTPEVLTLTVSSYSAGTVTFSADVSSDYEIGGYAYYPASIATTTDLVIDWPTAVDGAKVQVPMVAKINTSNNTAVFKHLGAVAKIAVSNVPVGATKLKFTANTDITGSYTVDYSGDDPAATASSLSGTTITATISSDGTYYIPLPTAPTTGTSYANFQFALINSTDTYYYKQKTATSSFGPFNRKQIVNFGTLTYDVDQIAEWWHVSEINGFQSGYDRYIKTGENTYQLTVFNPTSNKYWRLRDGSSQDWTVKDVDGDDSWSGKVQQTGKPFNRSGADDKTFWVTVTKDGSNWNYNSGNYGDNSSRGWSASGDPVKFSSNLDIEGDGTGDWDTITLTKYNYDANYGYKYEGLTIPDNNEYEFKFILNGTWCGSNSTILLTDAVPYSSGDWGGSNNMKFKLTAGTYNIYIDVDQINFMFVKQ